MAMHVIGYRLDHTGLEFRQGQDIFLFSETSRPCIGLRLLCSSFGGQSGRPVKLATHLHLVPGSKMSASVYLFPIYTFVEWRKEAFMSKVIEVTLKKNLKRLSYLHYSTIIRGRELF